MSMSAVSDVYDRIASWGDPIQGLATPTWLDRLISPPIYSIYRDFWVLGDWDVRFPPVVVRPAPEVQRMMRELRRWTSWSARRAAEVITTSHTTVLAIEDGRSISRRHSGDLERRIEGAHAIVSRVFLLAGRDAALTARVLGAISPDGSSAASHIAAEAFGAAYVAALDALRAPDADGLLVGSRPSQPGEGTSALHD